MKKCRCGLVLLQYFPTLFILCIPSLETQRFRMIPHTFPGSPKSTSPRTHLIREQLSCQRQGPKAFQLSISPSLRISFTYKFRCPTSSGMIQFPQYVGTPIYSHTYAKLTKSGRFATNSTERLKLTRGASLPTHHMYIPTYFSNNQNHGEDR